MNFDLWHEYGIILFDINMARTFYLDENGIWHELLILARTLHEHLKVCGINMLNNSSGNTVSQLRFSLYLSCHVSGRKLSSFILFLSNFTHVVS